MREVGDIYEEMVKPHLSSTAETAVPFYSSVTGQLVTSTTLQDPAYWRSNLESPVLFSSAVEALLNDLQHKVLVLEVGPHSTLQGPLNQIFQKHSKAAPIYVPTLIRGNNSASSALRAAGQLYVHGCAIHFAFINPSTHILTDLPSYPWDHKVEFWNESRTSLAWRHMKHHNHELLGLMCIGVNNTEPIWRNLLHIFDIPWLKDHKVVEDIIFPCAAYIAMIGEAIRQMTGSEVYTIQNLIINAAMVLQESGTIEVITTMKPARLTDSANSSWFDFSISSFNGATWTRHCTAQGKAGQTDLPPGKPITSYPRLVSTGFWYERLKHLGLNYGPSFQGMKEISAHTTETVATAAICDNENEHMSKYAVHPTTIDLCLQLFTVAMTSGVARRLDAIAIPTSVGHIYVKPASGNLVAEATARANSNGYIRGEVVAVAKGNEVNIRLSNARFSPLTGGDRLDSIAAARLVWRPDIDFLSPADLMCHSVGTREIPLLVEKVCALSILRIVELLPSLDIPPGYLVKFSSWLNEEKDRMARGEWNCLVPEAQQYISLDGESRDALCNSVNAELEAMGNQYALSFARAMALLSDDDHVRGVFEGKVNPLQAMAHSGGFPAVYDLSQGRMILDEFFSLCAHAQPTLKVLEIGAGTGGTTKSILKALVSKGGVRTYSQYTFTDISPGFFAAAKERFKEYPGMSFKVLDISKDPAEQDFGLGAYDLIVASNVSLYKKCPNSYDTS